MNIESSYDLAIIGSGAGGAEAALEGARRGARVLLIEKHLLGGGALFAGTIPMRSLMASERFLRWLRSNHEDAGAGTALMSGWVSHQRRKVSRLAGRLKGELRTAGVEVQRGAARLLGEGRLRITDQSLSHQPVSTVRATSIILATGMRPREAEQAWPESAVGSSRRFMSLAETPDRLVIIGGGHIGCEFACVYNALGAEVTLLEKSDRLLPEMDREAGAWLRVEFEKNGIGVHLNAEARAVWGNTSGEFAVAAVLPDGGEILANKILLATGRVPNVLGLGLEEAGIRFSAERGIEVDEFLQTSAPGVFAIGDVNGLCTLADSARAQARIAVENALGARRPFVREGTPRCVHTDPPVAAIGLLEEDARAVGLPVRAASAEFRSLPALHDSGEAGLVKLIADVHSGQLRGGMIVGDRAPEWIGELSVALQMGADAADFAEAPRAQESFAAALRACVQEMFGHPNDGWPAARGPDTPLGAEASA